MSDASAQTAIWREFAGRRRKFELRLGEIGELERLSGAGLGAIYWRVVAMQWKWDDIRETIRLGLIGGGATEPDATALALHYLDDRPKAQFLQLAADVLGACINGAAAGNADGEAAPSASPETSSPSMNGPAPSA
jgi:hypothetical protein